MSQHQKAVAVAILNWNGLELLQRYLPSVLAHSPEADVVVVDNGSTDGSLDYLRSIATVQVLALDANHGYAQGYNLALQQLPHPLVLLLNSDVQVGPGWLPPLLATMQVPQVAACQPKILAINQPSHFEYAGASGGFIDAWGYPFCRGRLLQHCEEDQGQYDQAMPVLWASGAALLVRREAFLAVGGLQASFFAHMEEIDLCWRLQRAGHQVWVQPASAVWHLGGASLSAASSRKTMLNFRNNLLMLLRNLPASYLLWLFPLRLLLDGLAGLQLLVQGRPGHCWAIVQAHFQCYARLLATLRQRKGPFPHPDSLQGWYRGHLIIAYYLKGKRKFSQLRYTSHTVLR